MKIAIIGAGMFGCTLSNLLSARKHKIDLFDKEQDIGGLCRTYYKEDLKYEYGGHIFHTNREDIFDFVTSHVPVRLFKHYVGVALETINQVYDLPINRHTIDKHPQKEKIMKELANLSQEIDRRNFETAVISMLGETLYNDFIRNYTRRMWRTDPKNLSSEWVKKRIGIDMSENPERSYFKDKYQLYPLPDFNALFSSLTRHENISTHLGLLFDRHLIQRVTSCGIYDIVISSNPIDETLEGDRKLQWVGLDMKFPIFRREYWYDNMNYNAVNFPNSKDYEPLRVIEYKKINGQVSNRSIVSQEYPTGTNKHYPVSTPENEKLFQQYLRKACACDTFMVGGRLGLYRYINMDEAVEMAMNYVPFVENYRSMSLEERCQEYQRIRK